MSQWYIDLINKLWQLKTITNINTTKAVNCHLLYCAQPAVFRGETENPKQNFLGKMDFDMLKEPKDKGFFLSENAEV